jgi:hypothetical protein
MTREMLSLFTHSLSQPCTCQIGEGGSTQCGLQIMATPATSFGRRCRHESAMPGWAKLASKWLSPASYPRQRSGCKDLRYDADVPGNGGTQTGATSQVRPQSTETMSGQNPTNPPWGQGAEPQKEARPPVPSAKHHQPGSQTPNQHLHAQATNHPQAGVLG